MRDRNAIRLLLYFIETVGLLIICHSNFTETKENHGSSEIRGSKTKFLCPHHLCHCFFKKSVGIISRCTVSANQIPKFKSVNMTYNQLSLQGQNITKVLASAFANIRARLINLSGNRFEDNDAISTDAFVGLEGIVEVLVFSESEMTAVPGRSLSKLTHLRGLRLDGNRISQLVARSLEANGALRELYLYRNQIIQIEPDAFVGLGKLQQLKLSENRIRTLPLRVFAPLIKLTSLDLSSNWLSEILPDTFVGLSKLRWLELNSNRLHTLERKTFRGLRNAKYMKLEYNPLTIVRNETFKSISKLEYLSVDLKNVTELTQYTLSGLIWLETLNLGELCQPTLPLGFFTIARRLRNLSITDHCGVMVGGLTREMFAPNVTFAGMKIWMDPVRSCSCVEPWIRDLVTLGAYVHGYCPKHDKDTPPSLSCFKDKHKSSLDKGKRTNEDRIRTLKPRNPSKHH